MTRVADRFFWPISRPGFGILKEKGTRFGIVIMTGTRDLAILTSGNREMSLKRNRDSGIPEPEICKENQAVILAHLINVGNSSITLLCDPYSDLWSIFVNLGQCLCDL